MRTKTAKILLYLFVFALLAVAAFIGLANLEYFNVKNVSVSVSGPVSGLSSDAERIVRPLNGKSIISLQSRKIKKQLLKTEGVSNVEFEKFFPSEITISVEYSDYPVRFFCTDSSEKHYYLASESVITEVSKSCFDLYSEIPSVEMNYVYAQNLIKWGVDNGYVQMVNLAGGFSSKSLISDIKYINNNGNFGRMIMRFSSLDVVLTVREPVTAERLDEAVDVIRSKITPLDSGVEFDLYSNALVERSNT